MRVCSRAPRPYVYVCQCGVCMRVCVCVSVCMWGREVWGTFVRARARVCMCVSVCVYACMCVSVCVECGWVCTRALILVRSQRTKPCLNVRYLKETNPVCGLEARH